MNTKKLLIATVIGFIFVFASDFVLHGILLSGMYEATAHLWRTMEDMNSFMPYRMLPYLFLPLLFAVLYCGFVQDKKCCSGARFGLILGVLMGMMQASMYFYSPIPVELALAWFGGTVVQMTVLGMIVGWICQSCCKGESCAVEGEDETVE